MGDLALSLVCHMVLWVGEPLLPMAGKKAGPEARSASKRAVPAPHQQQHSGECPPQPAPCLGTTVVLALAVQVKEGLS